MDGRRLAAFGEWGGAKCQEAAVWDLTSGAELGRYKGGELQIHGVGFYADGRAVCLSCVQDTLTVTLREIQGGKVLVPKVRWGGIAQFSADGSVFLKGDVFDSKTGRVLHNIGIPPEHWAPSEAFCMSRDKRFVAVNEVMKKTLAPAQVSVYEASSGKLVQAIKLLDAKQQLAQARSLDLAPDGKRLLVTVGSQARVYDVASGKELVRWDLKGVTWQSMGCDISPDGHFAVVKGTGGKTICLFGMPR
jgi:WD40 repeat protein